MISYIQSLAGITTELLQEAREDTIANNQGNKLIQIHNSKEPQPYNKTPIELVKDIAQQTIPKYIQWTINQYITDPTITLKDLPSIKKLQQDYDKINTNKTNINNLTVKQLTDYLQEDQGGQHNYSILANRFYQAMRQAVKNGDGVFKLESADYCVYTPKNWEGSKCLRRANPSEVTLCTTYLESSNHYDNYSRNGILDYILTPDSMYLCYIPTSDPINTGKPFEFADYANVHKPIPLHKKVKDTLYPDFKLTNDIFCMLATLQPNMNDKLEQVIVDFLYDCVDDSIYTIFVAKWRSNNTIQQYLTDNVRQAIKETNTVPNNRAPENDVEAENALWNMYTTSVEEQMGTKIDALQIKYENNQITTRSQIIELAQELHDVWVQTKIDVYNNLIEENPDALFDIDAHEFCDGIDEMLSISYDEYLIIPPNAVSQNFPTFNDYDDTDHWYNKLNNQQKTTLKHASGLYQAFFIGQRNEDLIGADELSNVILDNTH